MEKAYYPMREALVSCAVVGLTAGLFMALLAIVAILVVFWS